MKYTKIIAVGLILMLANCTSSSVKKNGEAKDESETADVSEFIIPPKSNLPVLEFKENWVYVVAGREGSLTKDMPITDIVHFGAEVDSYGKLTSLPKRSAIPSSFKGRVHLVIACSSRSLTHFTLKPGSIERKEYIADVLEAAKQYDGLNVDFEYIPARDGEAFHSFLRELREGLPKNKMFTMCVPARVRKLDNDIFDYEKMTKLVDRVFVMAYDEHWSGSKPGSVASIGWCKRVAEHAIKTIGPEKLIMGLPFYGRAWGDYSPSRALIHSSVSNIIKEHQIKDIQYENGVPTFTYRKNVSIKLYYEDEYSLVSRMNMYKILGVKSIGFWRLGQETADVWKYIKISDNISVAGNKDEDIKLFTPTTTTTLASVNTPAPAPRPAAPAPVRYTVKPGDSLWTIGKRYGVTPQALANANGIKMDDILHVGKVLRIP